MSTKPPPARRPTGRRKEFDEPMSNCSTRMPVSYHDQLIRRAKEERTSVAAAARKILMHGLRPR